MCLCRARDLLQRQLDKLPAESTSPVITALREDLQQLLSGYQTHTTYMSSRHHGLSMSSSHRSQRHTSHVSTGPATVNPYASRTQQDYSRRATTSVRASASNAQPQAQPTNASMPAPSSRSDPAALFAAAQLAAVSRHARREPSASLPRVSSTNASLDWLAGVQQGRHDSSAADAGHRRTGPESVLTGRRQTSDRASLQRAPSNVSAAGQQHVVCDISGPDKTTRGLA